MWVSLIEKAFAKFHKRYDCIDGGEEVTALRALSGAPCMSLDSSKSGYLFTKLKEAEDKNWVITCGTKADGSQDVLGQGLVAGHAYSVLKAYIVKSKG